MKNTKKKRRAIVITIAIILSIAILMCCVFFAIFPAHAVERTVITNQGGSSIHIDGFDIWYSLFNENSPNTPVIVVAGGAGLSSDYLEESLLFLSENHPLLFFDNRGCGRSQIKPDLSNYTITAFAEEIKALKDTFFPDKNVVLLAHSFGGIIAMEYAARYESTMDGLILVSSVGAKYAPPINGNYLKTGLPPYNQTEANNWYMDHVDVFLEPYFQNESVKNILDHTIASYAVIMKIGNEKIDLTEEMREVIMPVLILVGGNKEHPISQPDTAQRLHDIFTNSQFEQFNDCGHFMFAENPSEFQLGIYDFLYGLN